MAVTLKSCAVLVDVRSVVKDGMDLSSPEDALTLLKNFAFTNGSAAAQAHEHWHDERTLTLGANEELNLQALTNGPFGRTVAFTDIRAILFVAVDATGNFELGGAAANAWEAWVKAAGDIRLVKKGGVDLWVAPTDGDGAVSGTVKQLKILNADGANSQKYRIWILGTTS